MNERPELPPRREGGLRRLSPSVHWAQSFRAYKNKVVNRSIYDFELLYIQEGQCTVRVGSHAPYELAAGQLFYLPSRVRHSIVVTSERIDYVAVHFDYFDEFAAWDMPSLAVDDANVLPERFCAEPDVGQETYLFTHLVPEPAAVAL
ncbi:cupin domain-containing protein, partial [Paenibacillus sp.]|uniref:cupin domain-containing protein n=1 Tax=Paenibacillus sp. TaxID=58172 RepID=UPI002D575366